MAMATLELDQHSFGVFWYIPPPHCTFIDMAQAFRGYVFLFFLFFYFSCLIIAFSIFMCAR